MLNRPSNLLSAYALTIHNKMRERQAIGSKPPNGDFRTRSLQKKSAVLSFVLVCCSQLILGESAAKSADSIKEAEVGIRLDLRPFTDPVAKLITLRSSGQISVVLYLPSRLLVTASYERTLPEGDMMRLRTKILEPAIQKALRGKGFAGEGLSRGDQFRLLVTDQERVEGEVGGVVNDAPQAIRSLIDELLQHLKQQEKFMLIKLAHAYLKSESIEDEREKGLRKAGKIRFVAIAEFPADLQPTLMRAINSPIAFHPLSHSQYERLLKWCSYGNELFVVMEKSRSAFQLSLYSTK